MHQNNDKGKTSNAEHAFLYISAASTPHTHTSPTLELYNFPSLQFSLKSFEYYNNESFKGDITLSDTPKRTIIQLHEQKFKTIIDNHVIKFVAQVD